MGKMMISPRVFLFFKNCFFGSLGVWAGGEGVGVKGQKIAQNDNKNHICHTAYLGNSVAYDNFWCTCVK